MINKLLSKINWKLCHHKLQIVDYTDAGNFVVHCAICGCAWVADCVVEGFGFKMTKSAMSRGCKECRSVVFNKIKNEETHEGIEYHCPVCNEDWKFSASPA